MIARRYPQSGKLNISRTILISTTNNLSNRTNKVIFGLLGIIYIAAGTSKFYQLGTSFETIGFVILGLCYLIYGMIIFSTTPISPRVQISDSEIITRTKLFGPTKRLNWSNVHSIEFSSYEIQFQMSDGHKSLVYSCSPETSVEIKRSIREFAENKDIEVTGG